jgi:hypothetical protein
MNKEEASQILRFELSKLRSMKNEELLDLITLPIQYDISGPIWHQYQVEIQAVWDDPSEENGNVRVIASIDDGSLISSLRPITLDFILSSSGDFVDE